MQSIAERLWIQSESDDENEVENWQAYRRASCRQVCLYLLALPILIGVLIYDRDWVVPVLLLVVSFALLVEGYDAQRTGFIMTWKWELKRLWVTGEKAKRRARVQLVAGFLLLALSMWFLIEMLQ
jgi:uncharacterized membrane protein